MTDRQAQYRASKAKERKAKRDAGLVPVEIWVPAPDRQWIKTAVEMLIAIPMDDERRIEIIRGMKPRVTH